MEESVPNVERVCLSIQVDRIDDDQHARLRANTSRYQLYIGKFIDGWFVQKVELGIYPSRLDAFAAYCATHTAETPHALSYLLDVESEDGCMIEYWCKPTMSIQ